MGRSLTVAAGTAAASTLVSGGINKILGANDEIRVAVIGCRGKGAQHIRVFRDIPNVKVAAICDPDEHVLAREKNKFTDDGETVDTYKDMRYVMDRRDIQAVVIAAPNHWHALAGIWACQAEKDAYVEKPISHNIWEGRQLVKAARRYNRILQTGTQNRSDVGMRAFLDYAKEEKLGQAEWAHGLWFKKRDSIGNVKGPQPIPEHIDYNLWTGPALLKPLRRENLHYDWHWFWETGNGDMANLGVHQIDDCRFLTHTQGLPKHVISFGERWGYVDDGQTPNTQLALYKYDDIDIFIQIRNLPMKAGTNAMDHVRGVRAGNIVKFKDGYFAGGRGGGWFYDLHWNKVKQFPGDGGAGHQANFIDAVRKRDHSILHAEIEQGHVSSALCHAANISYVLGQHNDSLEPAAQAVEDVPQVAGIVDQWKEHLAANTVDLHRSPIRVGPWLQMNTKDEKFVGDWHCEANMFVSETYRKPFVVPKNV